VEDNPRNSLLAIKEKLGDLTYLDFTCYDLVKAHYLLGLEVKEKAQQILARKLLALKQEPHNQIFELIQKTKQELISRSQSDTINHKIRNALSSYLTCLEAWGNGARLRETASEINIPTLDLALLLQNDTSGCQTGLARIAGGSVILWHTEEDADGPGFSRFDKPRLLTFRLDDGKGTLVTSFIYPDLLPGPTFGWRDDLFFQAVDALHIHQTDLGMPKLLVNTACWISLMVGSEVELSDIIKSLSPFLDAAAINIVYPEDEGVSASKVEFGGDRHALTVLPSGTGSFLFQTNACSEIGRLTIGDIEQLQPAVRQRLEDRIDYTNRAIKNFQFSDSTDLFPSFLKLIASTSLGDFSYANEDVRAFVVCQVYPDHAKIAVGSGPAVGEEPDYLYIP
jgi:hypothetical protein